MFAVGGNTGNLKTTSYKVVLPFYVYAAFSFLVATVLLIIHASAFEGHYFQSALLAITHTMALGWGTMVILGASHQLVPVLIGGELFSDRLGYASFGMAAIGIPLLAGGFYTSNFGAPAIIGGALVVVGVIFYLVNLCCSIFKSHVRNFHAIFILAATIWLLVTAIVGLLLLCNLSWPILPLASIHYLSLHAHLGIVGWFLLTVIGVGSRLIPMFLISKYNNTKLLRAIFYVLNASLVSFVVLFFAGNAMALLLPAVLICCSLFMFGYSCHCAFKERIRKQVDEQMKVSLLSVGMILLPLIVLAGGAIMLGRSGLESCFINAYGFLIFFGWITAIIFGMTFKTLPFIAWYKKYRHLAGKGGAPNPKELFSARLFKWMVPSYVAGLLLFFMGIITVSTILLKSGAYLLLFAAVLYVANVLKIVLLKPKKYGYSN